MLKKYTNHIIENGIVYRGITTKRIIKPDKNGKYKIKYKGEETYHTLDELLNQSDDVAAEDIVVAKSDKDFNKSIIITMHMDGMTTADIAIATGKSVSFINKVKTFFVGVNNFKKICTNFKVSYDAIRLLYKVNYALIDMEDKLRLLCKYMYEESRSHVKSLTNLCDERGYSSGAMHNWLKYNGYNVKKMTNKEKMDAYEARVKK